MNKFITASKSINILLIFFNFIFIPHACAQITTFEELQQSSTLNQNFTVESNKILNNNHWAYKTLENISKRRNSFFEKSKDKFDINKPLTRNEAAILLIGITAKIQQAKIELTESEKAQLDILSQEFKKEMFILSGRIDYIENDISQANKSVYQLKENDSKNIKVNNGESFKIEPSIQFRYSSNIKKGSDSTATNFSLPLAQVKFTGKLQDGINFVTTIVPNRNFDSSSNSILSDAYIMTDKLKYHKIFIGQTRTPIGYEGTLSRLLIETPERSQIARNFSSARDIGLKITGNFPLLDYTLGAYNGNQNNRNDTNNSSLNYGTWLVVKPLYLKPKLGKLEIGGGNYLGNYSNFVKNTYSNDIYQSTNSLYSSYEFKRNKIIAEWAQKRGYNNVENQKANGWYIQNSLFLNRKKTHQLILKFDTFNPNTELANNNQVQYTLGYNYYKINNNLKFMFDFIHVDNKSEKDSDRLIIQTQCLF